MLTDLRAGLVQADPRAGLVLAGRARLRWQTCKLGWCRRIGLLSQVCRSGSAEIVSRQIGR